MLSRSSFTSATRKSAVAAMPSFMVISIPLRPAVGSGRCCTSKSLGASTAALMGAPGTNLCLQRWSSLP
eukprot:4002911-Pyramimonas_sp.AAC.1